MSSGGESVLRIGEVARRCGTTPRTIRYYEELGLLTPAAGREPGSHRLYGTAEVEHLEDLLRLKHLLGVSLEELREIATAESARREWRREWHEGDPDPERRLTILEESLGHVAGQLELARKRLAELREFEAELLARRRRIRARLRELRAERDATPASR